MPIDWDMFDSDIDRAIIESAEATKISSITRMTDEEVKELFPDPADTKKLVELMKIVKSSEDRNTKINSIVTKADEFGGIVLTLLDKLA